MKTDNHFRILIVDDNPAIHEDFRKILAGRSAEDSAEDDILDAFLSEAESAASTNAAGGFRAKDFDLTSAHQGEEAYDLVRASLTERKPFALAFVDVRMPPGWDGIQTLEKIFAADPNIQAVICTAYSDYSYEEMMSTLGASERLLILKKPFDPIEVQQLANALVEKWKLAASNRERLEEVRAYAASLETVNRALTSDKAMADEFSRTRTDFILGVGRALSAPASVIAQHASLPSDLAPVAGELLELLAQVSSLAELEGGLRRPVFGAARPCEAFEAAVSAATSFARSKGLTFQATGLDSLPERVRCDLRSLTELLSHLLQGALDICPGAGVQMHAAFESDPGSGSAPLRVVVKIDGLDLDPSAKATIFEAFGQESERLHLAIARQLARLQRWEMFAETNAQHGVQLILRAKLDIDMHRSLAA